MSKAPILQEGQSYTFRSYFEMPYEPDEILAELGYTLVRSSLSLPKTQTPFERLPELRQRLEKILPLVSLTSEMARREILVAPILIEVATYCNCQLRIEYPLHVNNWLKGNLDYLLRSTQNLLVVEAKNDDMTRGFTQMAVELIALSKIEEQKILYGAVTIGNGWQFGTLNVSQQTITQDIALYSIPGNLEELITILVGITQEN
ncbi:MAG: hypothetical protein F6K47_22160 [Symploca sp. SIO2E6]|nr:hypothetical protein [Symploca sp. SIO2E6]